jgi:16S rRNA (cytidine1402-2'-O)-methyltransferase
MDKNKQQKINSGLYLVSTPIGNMEDITLRAINILKKSDIILCEDTRRSLKLLTYHQIKTKGKLLAYHKFNEKKASKNIINFLKKNKVISIISDAGTPVISDPGMVLIKNCIDEKLNVYPIPGVSAATAAVSISGFNDQYLFFGFLSKKENELEKSFKKLSNLDFTIVFFIPAIKINFYISKIKKFFFDREILIAKEMTKLHEEYIRNKVSLINELPSGLRGELTIVLSNKINEKNSEKKIDESVKIEIKNMLKKYTHKDVVEFISKKENLPKKMVYNFCLEQKIK